MKLPVTYNSGSNIILVTGYSETTPCTFTDVYDANVAGSWGRVTRQCTDQFCFSANLQIGDGSTATWFADIGKCVLFTASPTTSGAEINWIVLVKANATFRLGEQETSTNKTSSNGCSILYTYSSTYASIGSGYYSPVTNANVEIYSSQFISKHQRVFFFGLTDAKLWNCMFNINSELNRIYSSDIFNITIQKTTYGFVLVTGTIDKIVLTDNTYALHFSNTIIGTPVIKNVFARDNDYLIDISGLTVTHVYLVNCDSNTWALNWRNTSNKNVYRQYEFDLKMVDTNNVNINGATVKIWDNNNTLIINTTTDTSGSIITQTITYGYYNQANGNTLQQETPHESRVYKYGKIMLSNTTTISTKTDWQFAMKIDPYITQTIESTVAAYTGINIDHSTETITINSNHTLNEIYDYCQYNIIASTKQIDQTMFTNDGINYRCEYDFIINNGISVASSNQRLTMVSGKSYTLTGTADFTGIIADQSKSRVFVTIVVKDAKTKALIENCRVYVEIDPGGTEILKELTDVNGQIKKPYEHTNDIDIVGVARKATTSPLYKTSDISGTITSNGFSTIIQLIGD